MNEDDTQQQQQFTAFLDELEQLFLKHDIKSVSTYNNGIIFRRPKEEDWLFDFWTDETSYTWASVRKYKPVEPKSNDADLESVLDEIMTEPKSAPLIPLSDRPKTLETPGSISLSERLIQKTIDELTAKYDIEISSPEPEFETVELDEPKTSVDRAIEQAMQPETAVAEVEVEINPKIEEYINDLADRLYKTAKEMNFPKNTLGEYWTHPKVVFAVKKAGFNESAYTIISANTTYWNRLAERMKYVEALDKQAETTAEITQAEPKVPVTTTAENEEPKHKIETFCTDSPLGTWTTHYADYKDSVYIDSDKGRTAICNKILNWLLIFSRMHPELRNAPTRADLFTILNERFKQCESFQFKWYEFLVEVSYKTPIED